MNPNRLPRPEALQTQHVLELKIPPVAVVLIVATLMWAARVAVPSFEFFFPGKFLVSVSLAAVGLMTCVLGVVSFQRAKTTVNPTKPGSASALVVSGIYKYTRNPMYLGLLLALTGWAIFLANLAAIALVPVFVAYINRFQIQPEERALDSLFPQDYAAYRAKVRRWI